jgi:hypothetical protein
MTIFFEDLFVTKIGILGRLERKNAFFSKKIAKIVCGLEKSSTFAPQLTKR